VNKTSRFALWVPGDNDVVDVNGTVNANTTILDNNVNALEVAGYPNLASYSDGQLIYNTTSKTMYRVVYPNGAIAPVLVPYMSSSANARKGVVVNRTLTSSTSWTTALTLTMLDSVTPGSNWPGGNGIATVSGTFQYVNNNGTYPTGTVVTFSIPPSNLGFQLWLYINTGASASTSSNVALSMPIWNDAMALLTNAGTEQGDIKSVFGEVPFNLPAAQYTFSIWAKTCAWVSSTSGSPTSFGFPASPYTHNWFVNHLGSAANQL